MPWSEHDGAADARVGSSADERLTGADMDRGSDAMFALDAEGLILLPLLMMLTMSSVGEMIVPWQATLDFPAPVAKAEGKMSTGK